MKFIKPLILLGFIGLFSCENESNSIQFSESNITTSTNEAVTIIIPEAIGESKVAMAINAAMETVVLNSFAIEDEGENPNKPTSYEQAISTFNNANNSFKSQFPDASAEWAAKIDGEVTFQSKTIITVIVNIYNYKGGAHGNTYTHILNFSKKTGKQLTNAELYTNKADFKNTIKPFYTSEVTQMQANIFKPNKFSLPKQMGYTEDGFVCFYNTYEIAPYSDGPIEFVIPYSEVEHVLNY